MRSFKAECLHHAARASEGRCESGVLSGEGEGARGSVDTVPFIPTAGVKLLGLQKSSRCLYSCTAQRLRHECPVPSKTSVAAAHPLSTHILPDGHQSRGSPCRPPSESPAQVSTRGQRQITEPVPVEPRPVSALQSQSVRLHPGQPSSGGGRQRPVRSAYLGVATGHCLCKSFWPLWPGVDDGGSQGKAWVGLAPTSLPRPSAWPALLDQDQPSNYLSRGLRLGAIPS